MTHLGRSATGDELSAYHLQAGIAACHCTAGDYASTDWERILELYDHLIALDDSPVIALNRAVALAQVLGPKAGLKALAEISRQPALESYHLLYAVQGEFEVRLNDYASAAEHFRKALELTDLKSEQAYLAKRLGECTAAGCAP